jgi:hypothetical protein
MKNEKRFRKRGAGMAQAKAKRTDLIGMSYIETIGWPDNTTFRRQGEIIGYADESHVIITVHEWGFGSYTYSMTVPISEMTGWWLFRTKDEFDRSHDSGSINNVLNRLDREESRKAKTQ